MASPQSVVHDDLNNLRDPDLFRSLMRGTGIGVPVAFVAAAIIASFAAPWPGSLLIAAWGAIVAGPFVGALVALVSRAAAEERAHQPETAPVEKTRVRGHKPRLA